MQGDGERDGGERRARDTLEESRTRGADSSDKRRRLREAARDKPMRRPQGKTAGS